jgi:enamine deaminase RidA (YjgF/YER057c/UK114 family)
MKNIDRYFGQGLSDGGLCQAPTSFDGRSKDLSSSLDLPITGNFGWSGRMSAEAKLEQMGLSLPAAPKPMGVYKPILIVDNLAYLSGHGPVLQNGSLITGRLGDTMDLAGGYAAARQTGLALMATLRNALGSLDQVKRLVKTLGLVNCTADFDQQPQVINGCSELFAEVFGMENGVAVRSALGTNALPGGIAVEIEMIVEVRTG